MQFNPLKFLFLFSILVALCTTFGFFGKLWWVLDLTSHFRVQYFFFLATTTFVFFIGKHYRKAYFSFFFALVNVSCIIPLYIGIRPVPMDAHESFRTLTINLSVENNKNTSYELVRSFIQKQKPDFLLLSEYDQIWRRELKEVLSHFSYSLISNQKSYFGIGLFSRLPFKKGSIKYIGKTNKPSVVAEYSLGGKLFTLVGTHLMSPRNQAYARERNMQLEGLEKFLNTVEGPKMLIGDLNITSWSPHFSKLIQATHLRDTRKGRGVHPTWPRQFPFFLIPLDHCLVSNEIFVVDRKIGNEIESDHYPITVDFSFMS